MIATASDPDQEAALRALGAHHVVRSPDELEAPVFGVLDMVGGSFLVSAYAALQSGGTLVSIGQAAQTAIDFGVDGIRVARFGPGYDRTITRFYLFAAGATHDLAPDLTWLSGQVATGRLDPQVAWRGDWTRFGEAAGALLGRRLHGKAVLDIA